MNKKVILGIGIGTAIIVMILATQNVEIEPKTNMVETNVDCVSEFRIMFPDEDEDVLKNLCDNSEYRNELYPFPAESNVNSYGFKGPEFSSNKPIDTYRIFLVGGSTMWGDGNYSDETTIPGILQKIFDKQKPLTKIEVINAGISGANTISESKMIEEKIINYQPDLIVMYDGWNDLRAQYSPETIYNNWKSVCEIGNQNELDVIITLQPIAGFGNKDLTKQEFVNALTGNDHNQTQLLVYKNQYEEYANSLQDLSTTCTVTKDLRNIFDDVSGSIFWDQGHTSDAGNMIVAEKMYEISSPIIQKNLPSHTLFIEILKKYNNPTVISYLLEQYGVERKSKTMTLKVENQAGRYFELREKIGIENILIGKDLTNIDLSNLKLVDQDLTGVNLTGQDLRNIDISGTVLRNVDFTNANLSGLDLTKKILDNSIFHETELYDTKLIGTYCKYCKISNTDFSNSQLIGLDFKESVITNSDFSNTRIFSTVFGPNTIISNTDFSNSDLSYDPRHFPLQKEIELDKFDMTADELTKLDYNQLRDTINRIFYPSGGHPMNLLLTNIVIEDKIVFVNYLVINSFTESKLSNVNFSNSDLTGLNFHKAEMSNVDFLGADTKCMFHDDVCHGTIQKIIESGIIAQDE